MRLSILRCFFLRMRLRRFLIRDPMTGGNLTPCPTVAVGLRRGSVRIDQIARFGTGVQLKLRFATSSRSTSVAPPPMGRIRASLVIRSIVDSRI